VPESARALNVLTWSWVLATAPRGVPRYRDRPGWSAARSPRVAL